MIDKETSDFIDWKVAKQNKEDLNELIINFQRLIDELKVYVARMR